MSTTKGTDDGVPVTVRPDRTLKTLPGESEPELVPFADQIRHVLDALGEDTGRDGLLKTPERVEASLRFLTQGYHVSVADAIGEAVFAETHQSMIMVRDIELYSLCEHHLLPFFGRAHVAYVPNGKILGLSKVARIVDVFARRLQVQERLTDQIADAIMDVLMPSGVGVVIEAAHFCMMMRGVQKQNSRTVTSALRGIFRDDSKTRVEFLRLAHGGHSSE
jgi:GTP cyclohydrolase I